MKIIVKKNTFEMLPFDLSDLTHGNNENIVNN